MNSPKKTTIDTLCVKEKDITKSGESHVYPLHATSSYSYESIEDSIDVFQGKKEGFVYSRYANPTVKMVEDKIAKLEGHGTDHHPSCIMTNSGLSAISTLCMSVLKPGDGVITQADLYGGSTEIMHKLLSKFGVHIYTVNLLDLNQVEDTLKAQDNIKLLYFETPSNPMLKCLDMNGLTSLAKKYNCQTAIDNTFSTFYLQQPFKHGVDFILYSTTKYLNGHGNAIGGAILSKDPEHRQAIWETMKLVGTNSNAWEAWLLHNGLKTLAIRLDRHCTNALQMARHLNQHASIKQVHYPGLESHPTHHLATTQMSQFGGMMSFEIDGSIEDAKAFMNNTKLCTIAATLGNVDTLLLHPATASHLNIPRDVRMASGITDGLIRMSVGIEHIQDLIDDVDQALAMG